MNKNLLPEKLNKAFDINAAVITKTQSCRTGRWVCSCAFTALSGALYGVLVWGALQYLYGSLLVFLLCLISAALVFVLFRIWLAFIVDAAGSKFAERCVMLRRGDRRYYYTRNRRMSKFEYSGGLLVSYGDDYDKFENKKNYSPLASRYSKSLQRRSSLYNTLTPSFWAELLESMDVTENGNVITAEDSGSRIKIVCCENGKVRKIEFVGKSDYLFDSLSPIKIFNGKFWGKYKFTYTFRHVKLEKLSVDKVFEEATSDFLMPKPNSKFVEFTSRIPFDEWIKATDLLSEGNAENAQEESEPGNNILSVNANDFGVERSGETALKLENFRSGIALDYNGDGVRKNRTYGQKLPLQAAQSDNKAHSSTEEQFGVCALIACERANYNIYKGLTKPYIGKTTVRDWFKLIDIYKK